MYYDLLQRMEVIEELYTLAVLCAGELPVAQTEQGAGYMDPNRGAARVGQVVWLPQGSRIQAEAKMDRKMNFFK